MDGLIQLSILFDSPLAQATSSSHSRGRSRSPTRRTRVVEVTRSIVEEKDEEDDGEDEYGLPPVVKYLAPPIVSCHCFCRPPTPAPAPGTAPAPRTQDEEEVMGALETLADAAFAACERSVPSPNGLRAGAAVLCHGEVIIAGHAASSHGLSALRAALTEAMRQGNIMC